MVDSLLTAEDLEKIQNKARWSEELNEWVIQSRRLQYLQNKLSKRPKMFSHPESPNVENENKLKAKINLRSEPNTIENNPKTRQANNPYIESDNPQITRKQKHLAKLYEISAGNMKRKFISRDYSTNLSEENSEL